jgi:hypothetical protein
MVVSINVWLLLYYFQSLRTKSVVMIIVNARFTILLVEKLRVRLLLIFFQLRRLFPTILDLNKCMSRNCAIKQENNKTQTAISINIIENTI